MYFKIQPDLLIGFSEVVRRFYVYYEAEIKELHIKESHAKTLHLISDHEGLTQQEIANISMTTRSTTSEIISEMVKAGLVERRSDPQDKRVARIYMTEHGQVIAKHIREYFDEYCKRSYKNYTHKEIVTFEQLLQKFTYHN